MNIKLQQNKHLVPLLKSIIQSHLVAISRTKIKTPPIWLKFGMVGGIGCFFHHTKSEPNRRQKISTNQNQVSCLLWLLKPNIDIPLYYISKGNGFNGSLEDLKMMIAQVTGESRYVDMNNTTIDLPDVSTSAISC